MIKLFILKIKKFKMLKKKLKYYLMYLSLYHFFISRVFKILKNKADLKKIFLVY